MGPGDTADMLHRIKRALMARSVAAVDPRNPPMVINARVPLVMYTDAVSGVEVDVSVCNHGGVFKSRFVQQLVKFDERFEALYRLVSLGLSCLCTACVLPSASMWNMLYCTHQLPTIGKGWPKLMPTERFLYKYQMKSFATAAAAAVSGKVVG